MPDLNTLRWDGRPGHYEVWFITLADRGSGAGIWLRFAIHAPLEGPADCSLWFAAMSHDGERYGARERFAIERLNAASAPFRLSLAGAELSDLGSTGAFGDIAWELRWEPGPDTGLPVHPLVERARLAKTMLVIPQPRLAIEGSVGWGGRRLELRGAHGAQAHLWGARHASRWGWAHAADLQAQATGEPSAGDWIDAISVTTPRLGCEIGPSSAVVGRLLGEPFAATGPLQVVRSRAQCALTSYRVRAQDGARRLDIDVSTPREALVGVVYEDPDGERLHCWNSEIASLRCQVRDRSSGRPGSWRLRETLSAPGRACFEYAQRSAIPGMTTHIGA